MERLKAMKNMLMSCAEGQMTHLDEIDAEELGEVIDMIKDLEEAIYYCTVIEAMNKPQEHGFEQEKQEHQQYYQQPMMYYDGGWGGGRSYYNGGGSSSSSSGGGGGSSGGNSGGSSSSGGGSSSSGYGGSSMQYTEKEYPYEFRDLREGRSPRSRRMYMESRETHQDKASQMRELEKYMQELAQDLVEMVEGASAEEKQYLSKKISALSNKLGQLSD